MKNEYTVTKKVMMERAKKFELVGALNIFFFVAWIIIAVVSLFLTVITVVLHMEWYMTYIMVLCLLLSIYKLFIERFIRLSHTYKLLSSSFGSEEWICSADFRDDDILLVEGSSSLVCQYNDITTIKEKGNDIRIYLNKNRLVIRMYKDAFVDCTWEECKQFILSKKNK